MASIFGGDQPEFTLGEQVIISGTTYVSNATSTTDAVVKLDETITLVPSANQPYEDIRLAINNVADVAALGAGIDAPTVKNLYESNFDTNAFTNAYKTTLDNIGTYIDASELAASQSAQDTSIASTYKTISSFNSDIANYRTSSAQDTIDSGKYSTSNPAGYQTSSQVVNSISDALIPYRTSADEDVINATKLATADLKSNIVLHPANAPTFLGVACCGGMAPPGMARTSTGDITPLSIIPPFPSSDPYSDLANGVVNFNGSNYYSYIYASGKAYTVESGGIYTNVSASTIFTTETATNDFVYKFATNGTVLVAISKSTSAVHIFWTTDGITWNPYSTAYAGGMRELVIYDNVVYIGTTYDILILPITDMQANAAYTTHSTGAFISSIVKTGTNTFVYLNENGMWISSLNGGASSATGFPAGATIGNENPGKITVAPWGLYAISGTNSNAIYKSTDGGANWSVILTASGDFYEVKTVHYSQDINVVLVGGYTNISTFLTLDSADNAVYYPTGLGTNAQDTGTYYIFSFGETYSGGGGGSGVSVLLDAGASTTANVYATLADLSTANTEIRTSLGSYALSADVTSEIAADRASQDASIALTYESKAHASSTYLTILNAASIYYPIANPSGYITSAALSGYKTIASFNSDIANYLTISSAAATYQPLSGMSSYLTTADATTTYKTISSFNTDIANYLTISSAAATYQPLSGMSSYLTTADATTTYKTISSFNTDISAYLTSSNAASTYRTIADSYTAAQTDSAITNALAAYPTNTYLTSNYTTTTNMNTAITQANNTQDATIASTYQTIAGMGAYYTSSQVNSAISSSQSTQDSSIAATYATLTQFGYLLRPKVKIVVSTGGSTTPVPGQGYSTIASALAAAVAGDVVFVCPGTYNESGLTLPADVELRGFSRFSCFISATPTTSTTVITIGGANAKITDMTITSTSTTNGANQTLLSIGSTFNTTFFMRNCNLTINGQIGNTDTANAICIDSTATGFHANDAIFNFIDCVFRVDANGLGIKRCFRATGLNSDHHFDTCQFSCIRTTAGSDYIAFEVNNSTADSQLTNCFINGTTADISATSGNIILGKSTVLLNANSNGIAFQTLGGMVDFLYMHIGNASANRWLTLQGEVNNAIPLRIGKPTVIFGLYFNARVLTTGVEEITIYKNGVATALTCTATNTTSASNTTVAVTFNTGDLLSVFANKVSGTVTDYWVQFSAY